MISLRWDPDRASPTRPGVRNALVLVRESWGSELLARLWALGVSRPAAEHYYAPSIRACWSRRSAAWSRRGPTRRALRGTAAAVGDSARLVRSDFPVIRRCGACRGTIFATLQLARRRGRSGIYPLSTAAALAGRRCPFARDLHGRDTLLLARPRWPGLPAQAVESRRRRGAAVLSGVGDSLRAGVARVGLRPVSAVATAHTELPKGSRRRVTVRASRRDRR